MSTTGLAFTEQELKNLEANGYEFTGWYNELSQPVVRDKKTGEELSFCRMGYNITSTCMSHIVI